MASASDVAARATSPVDVVPLPCTSPPLYSSAVMARSMYSRSPSGSVHTALPRTGSRNPASSPYPVTRPDHADVGEIAPERSGQLRQHLGGDHALGARLSPGQERGDIAAHQVREQAMGHEHLDRIRHHARFGEARRRSVVDKRRHDIFQPHQGEESRDEQHIARDDPDGRARREARPQQRHHPPPTIAPARAQRRRPGRGR